MLGKVTQFEVKGSKLFLRQSFATSVAMEQKARFNKFWKVKTSCFLQELSLRGERNRNDSITCYIWSVTE